MKCHIYWSSFSKLFTLKVLLFRSLIWLWLCCSFFFISFCPYWTSFLWAIFFWNPSKIWTNYNFWHFFGIAVEKIGKSISCIWHRKLKPGKTFNFILLEILCEYLQQKLQVHFHVEFTDIIKNSFFGYWREGYGKIFGDLKTNTKNFCIASWDSFMCEWNFDRSNFFNWEKIKNKLIF